jgi:hypothetical protein
MKTVACIKPKSKEEMEILIDQVKSDPDYLRAEAEWLNRHPANAELINLLSRNLREAKRDQSELGYYWKHDDDQYIREKTRLQNKIEDIENEIRDEMFDIISQVMADINYKEALRLYSSTFNILN